MLQRAVRAGVRSILNVGSSLTSSRRSIRLARRYRIMCAAVGVHPLRLHEVEVEAALDAIESMAGQTEVVAIGEVGLDRSATAPLRVQRAFLERCFDLANRLDLAVSLHVVGADDEALATLPALRPGRAVVHYFQGGPDVARSYLEAGALLSVGKPVTRAENRSLRQAVRDAPLTSLLLETDTYPLTGRTTEPQDVRLIAQAVAELKGIPLAEVAATTTRTFEAVFPLAVRGEPSMPVRGEPVEP